MLALTSSGFIMVPLSLEYSFWRERTPEAFACFGEPIDVTNGHSRTSLTGRGSLRLR